MISICGCKVNDKTCNAIGEFSVAWAQFEYYYFNNNYNATNAQNIIIANTTQQTALLIDTVREELLKYAASCHCEGSLVDRLNIRHNENYYIEIIGDFSLERYSTMEIDKKVLATIYIGSRIRSNMFHGLKDIATLNCQIKIFSTLSKFFVHLIEENILHS